MRILSVQCLSCQSAAEGEDLSAGDARGQWRAHITPYVVEVDRHGLAVASTYPGV